MLETDALVSIRKANQLKKQKVNSAIIKVPWWLLSEASSGTKWLICASWNMLPLPLSRVGDSDDKGIWWEEANRLFVATVTSLGNNQRW